MDIILGLLGFACILIGFGEGVYLNGRLVYSPKKRHVIERIEMKNDKIATID